MDVGSDEASSRAAVGLAAVGGALWAAVGVHPNSSAGVDDATWQRVADLAERERVVAIGETGLDFYRNRSPREVQHRAFRWHLALAAKLGRAVVVHSRLSDEAVLEELERASGGARVIWHCFSGTVEVMERAVELGCWISFAGNVTYPSATSLREVAQRVPDDRLLIETDCPYLAPVPRRGRRNEPSLVIHTAQVLAAVRGQQLERVAELTYRNAEAVFGLAD